MSDHQTDLGFDNESGTSAGKRVAKKAAAKKAARKTPAKKAAARKGAAKDATGKKAASSSRNKDALAASENANPPAPVIKAPKLIKGSDGPVPVTYSTDKDPEWDSPKKAPTEPPLKNVKDAESDHAEKPANVPDNKRDSREHRESGQQRDSRHSPGNHSSSQNSGGSHPSGGPHPSGAKHRFKQKPFNPNRDNKKKFGGPPPVSNKGQDRPRKKEFKKNPNRKPRGDRQRQDDTDSVIEFGDLFRLKIYRNEADLAAFAKDAAKDTALTVRYDELQQMKLHDLLDYGQRTYDIRYPQQAPNRDKILAAILTKAYEAGNPILAEGIVDLTDEGDGILVFSCHHYRVRANSVYIPKTMLRRFGIKPGTIVEAQLHPARKPLPDDTLEQLKAAGRNADSEDANDAIPGHVEDELAEKALSALFPATEYVQDIDADDETCPYAIAIRSVMGKEPEKNLDVVPFEDLVPYYPTERIILETDPKAEWDNIAMRAVDLLTPVGLGQRGLIVAPPRTGKTVIQQSIANAIAVNRPDTHLIVLLIDERPEEVTDFRRQIKAGEVIASTFDESPENHVHCAEMVIEKARRMVEDGRHVIILLDSITRLARAYNALASNSGKILSGGVEANALQKPKRFFGSARNIEGAGSLTIIGTALVETGSRMDEVIFEEFKGTGNMELHLDRQLSDKRIFPAIEMAKSGTRKEELLYHKDEMQKVYGLRRAMKGVPPTDAMEMLINRIKKTTTNIQFLMSLNS